MTHIDLIDIFVWPLLNNMGVDVDLCWVATLAAGSTSFAFTLDFVPMFISELHGQ